MNSFFDDNGNIRMLALDHRGSFEKSAPAGSDLVDIKYHILKNSYEHMTGCLIDDQYGLPAYSKLVNKMKPYIMPVEESGYEGPENNRITKLKFTANELKSMGSSGVKLLIYFDHTASSAHQQLETTKQAIADAHAAQMPFFLEIVTYGNSSVVESLETFVQNEIQPDVWKLEFPGSPDACKEVDNLAGKTPWILLTRGDTFDGFDAHLQIAHQSGCRGFLAGRSLWQEGLKLTDTNERNEFFQTTLPKRFETINSVFN